MVTIRDVANKAQVSVASASRALNGHSNVAPRTSARILEAARTLRYMPHEGARSLTRRRTDAVGVVLPDLFGEYFSELVRGIDRVAHAAGLQLLLSNMHGSPHETASAIRAMRGRVDGLLVMPPEGNGRYLEGGLPPGLPAVLLNHDRREEGAAGAVGVDNYGGARTMTRHLVERGYTRIAHIAGPRSNRDACERQRGFVDAIAAETGERSPAVVPGDYSEQGGADAARLLIASGMPIDAIFCANDMMAIGALRVLADAGLDVPGDIGVAGFDDIPLAHYVRPSLTTMKVRIADLGARAMEQLIGAMPGRQIAEAEVIEPQLIIRETTARARGRRTLKTDRRSKGTVTWPLSVS